MVRSLERPRQIYYLGSEHYSTFIVPEGVVANTTCTFTGLSCAGWHLFNVLNLFVDLVDDACSSLEEKYLSETIDDRSRVGFAR